MMTNLVSMFQAIDRMTLAEKELLAWYAGKELSKEKRESLEVESFVAEELNRYPAPPELAALNKPRGRPKNPHSKRGLLRAFCLENNRASLSQMEKHLAEKGKPISRTNLYTLIKEIEIPFTREGIGNSAIYIFQAA